MDITALIYDVSKDLYAFYRKAKGRDNDLQEIRHQSLWLVEKSNLVDQFLKREGMKGEDRSKVEESLLGCKDAVSELNHTVVNLKSATREDQKLGTRFRYQLTRLGLMFAWPLKKDNIAALLSYAKTCHNGLDSAIDILHLNVSISQLENIIELDRSICEGRTSMDNALRSMSSAIEKQLHSMSKHMAQQTKPFMEEQDRARAERIVECLGYDGMRIREQQIKDASDATYGWLFETEAQKHTEITDLVKFLNTGSGVFWISGEAATGKSTLMKYLAKPQRGGHSLWQWEGADAVTFACHYCWCAGSDMQKTQLALLLTLLHCLLQAELSLVPTVFQHIWDSSVSRGPWSIEELRICLSDAMKASQRHLCIFIDGLDELQEEPESNHLDLLDYLARLASYDHVKMVVSSRPWNVYKSRFSRGLSLHVEHVNKRAILEYLEKTVATSSGIFDSEASSVVQTLISEVAERSHGNFLWISLTMKSISSMARMGLSTASIKAQVENMPPDLVTYLRTMIYERGEARLIRIRAMAMSIALARGTDDSWVSYWLLYNSTNLGTPPLEDNRFPFEGCPREYDYQTIKHMAKVTKRFLDECCTGLLDVCHLQSFCEQAEDLFDWWQIQQISIPFVHRAIYDFLKTQEMQDLLIQNTPQSFQCELFGPSLMIARSKVALEARTVTEKMDVAFATWSLLNHTLEIIGETRVEEQATTISVLAKEADRVALHYLRHCKSERHVALWYHPMMVNHGSSWKPDLSSKSDRPLIQLCASLASYGQYDLTDAFVEERPAQACRSPWPTEASLLQYALVVFNRSPPSLHERQLSTNETLLTKLLAAGADPNGKMELTSSNFGMHVSVSTIWCEFLKRLQSGRKCDLDYSIKSTKASRPQESFRSAHAQAAIRKLIEHGAELELEPLNPSRPRNRRILHESDVRSINPLAVLRSALPMDEGSEWPLLLDHHIKPEQCKKLCGLRQRRVTEWSPDFLEWESEIHDQGGH